MSGYGLEAHGRMIADAPRTDAYARALEVSVRPGCVVLDVGTGSGILAMLACRLGARRVYAVEPDDVIQVARELSAANGMAGRITFIQGLSTEVELPERADVLVADVRGALPLFHGSVATLIDARERLLRPGGAMIPRRERLYAAAVEAPDAHAGYASPWSDAPYGLDLSAALGRTLNSWGKARPMPEALLAEPMQWAELDYRTVTATGAAGVLEMPVLRAGTLHGASAWFESELAEGVTLSTSPLAEPTIYGTAFFPCARGVPVRLGDTVHLSIRADAVAGEYVWRWAFRVTRGGALVDESTHSAFRGAVLTPERLRRRSHLARHALGEAGRIDAFVLGALDGEATVGRVAERLRDTFPDAFARWEDAVSRVADLADRYGV
ncbi:MAG: prmA [Gemmatimonadetes bacterium]|nr:prmA [Gemmatimonadota bacterium]